MSHTPDTSQLDLPGHATSPAVLLQLPGPANPPAGPPANPSDKQERAVPVPWYEPDQLGGVEHYVAPDSAEPGEELDSRSQDAPGTTGKPLFGQAWSRLRRQPSFWFTLAATSFIGLVAAWPSLFTSNDPRRCLLANSRAAMSPEFPLGADFLGCDILTTVIYGARASVSVGLLAALTTTLLGAALGVAAGYFGGWIDALISRITDTFFAIPLILGAIVAMQVVERRSVLTLVAILTVFGWTGTARIARSATIETGVKDYIAAARTLGARHSRILLTHIVPNIAAPVIVVITMAIGGLIAAEAALSFLNVGLPPDVPSWGKAISDGKTVLKVNPGILLWPAGALTFTVLNFLVLGDVIRNALGAQETFR
ncbi:MAG: ABC transporter permease [Bifidobacteriaceae bacterium]|jgi:oligopeptide transport system permease protein|nr:ABC transporter permease [Bifidobacteriaceae bacterium]